ncbi:aldehyde dehydrogenase family protein [Streptomyces alkaliphilus]|uniref:aldehyde dehydrogenase family protein n=1 Tax=Streptomyces alkaliphilus TaxID=1472722 RepID=UPI00118168DC|nr:aldehyde dehydrogenase family protein [Streptomyces alkaliphilus]MQS08001.1 aldehyde dehydrogenase family protein [Streptomyces alkaliphilus]
MADAPAPYEDFTTLPLAGTRRTGSGGEARADRDPWSGETLLEIPQASMADAEEALEAARSAQREWAGRLPRERAAVMSRTVDLLRRRRDEIIRWLVRESGSTLAKAKAEWAATVADFTEAASLPHRMAGRILPADIPGKESRVYRKPLGVVLVISPWNWPLHLSCRSLAPALALGNAVVLKPAGDTPVTGGLLPARLLEEAGLPAGLLSVVVAPGSEVGDPLVEHPIPRLVSFTGSTPVGSGIARKAGLKKLALELGGNAPLVVLDDADLPRAVEAAVFGSFFHQGQICIRTNRIIVDDSRHDEFVDLFIERVRDLRVGDPSDPDTRIGPLINAGQLDGVRDIVDRSVDSGAKLLLGGDPGGPTGLSLPPHVLLAGPDVPSAVEEVFGPVATILRARDEEHALELANDTDYGLSSAVFSGNAERGARFALRVDAGMTHVNDQTVNDQANTAFGGEKDSGLGRFGGEWALEEFTTDHWISVQHTPRRFAF